MNLVLGITIMKNFIKKKLDEIIMYEIFIMNAVKAIN